MKKILSLVMVVAIVALCSVSVFAADLKWTKVASYDFSSTEGLKGVTGGYMGDLATALAETDIADGVISDGKFIAGSMGLMVDKTVDITDGFKVEFDATLVYEDAEGNSIISGSPWYQGIVAVLNAGEGKADSVLAATGETVELPEACAYYCNFQGSGKSFQIHASEPNEAGTGNEHIWGGDPAALEAGTYHVVYTVLPAEEGVTVSLTVDGEEIGNPNNNAFGNYLCDDAIICLGCTIYGDYPYYLEMDNVEIYTMQEATSSSTGVATVALAVVAMLSGAYVVSKKH